MPPPSLFCLQAHEHTHTQLTTSLSDTKGLFFLSSFCLFAPMVWDRLGHLSTYLACPALPCRPPLRSQGRQSEEG